MGYCCFDKCKLLKFTGYPESHFLMAASIFAFDPDNLKIPSVSSPILSILSSEGKNHVR